MRTAQAPKVSAAEVRENRSWTTGKNRGHPPPLSGQAPVPKRIDTLVEWDQQPSLASTKDQPLSSAELQNLSMRDDAVLPFRKLPNRGRRHAVLHGFSLPRRTASTFPLSR